MNKWKTWRRHEKTKLNTKLITKLFYQSFDYECSRSNWLSHGTVIMTRCHRTRVIKLPMTDTTALGRLLQCYQQQLYNGRQIWYMHRVSILMIYGHCSPCWLTSRSSLLWLWQSSSLWQYCARWFHCYQQRLYYGRHAYFLWQTSSPWSTAITRRVDHLPNARHGVDIQCQ